MVESAMETGTTAQDSERAQDPAELARLLHTLRESEARFRSIFENVAVGMATATIDGELLQVNPALCRFLGYPEAELLRLKVNDITHPEHREETQLLFSQVASGKRRVFDYEKRYIRQDGSIAWGHATITWLTDANGLATTCVALILDITERKRIEKEFEELAYQDPLTRLPNRFLLKDRLRRALAQAELDGCHVGILALDLDRFKQVNDTLGLAAGDLFLKEVGERLQREAGQGDTVARLGGDEFVVSCPGLRNPSAMTTIARKILAVLTDPFELEGQEIYSSASIGISIAPLDGDGVDTLLKNAEMAMYAAKKQGGNTCRFYSETMNHGAAARLTMETSLRKAIQRNELFLVYHPQLDLQEEKLIGMEALLRWRHPALGIVPPGEFVPLAEETGLILAIGEWVLRTACTQNLAWQQAGYPPLRVAVNVSGCQIKQPDFVDLVDSVLRETGLAPRFLELELTESIFLDDVAETIRTLTALKARGILLAIDDFGTGYSSLSYLKHFPIDRIKIGQSFVCDITTGTDNATIIEAIIAMARSLNLKLVAEGVETREQFHFLQERQCHEMQGFYFSKPMGEADFTRYLARELAGDGEYRHGSRGAAGGEC